MTATVFVSRTTTTLAPSLVALIAIASSLTAADVTNTASTQLPKAEATSTSTHLHSWEAPALTVQGTAISDLRENELIGTYQQPRWTAVRRFTEVRTYVMPQNQIDFEYWLVVSTPSRREKDDAKAAGQPKPEPQIKQLYEVEMGLGHRLQLDLYQQYVKEGNQGDNTLDATKFELRYAFADWGKIWGNPTAYGEWKQAASGPDAAEFKLLLCDQIGSRWAWATNVVYEGKTAGDRETGYEWNSAIGYSAIDERLSVGVEVAVAYITALEEDTVNGGFLDSKLHHWEVAAGPSIRFYPTEHAHVILSEFIGLNNNAHESKTTLIVGWEF